MTAQTAHNADTADTPGVIVWGPATLHAAADLTPDIRLLEIAPAQPVTAVAPGSHLSLLLPIGPASDVRSYSIVGTAAGRVSIAVKRLPASRGGSAYLAGLAPGARLTVSRPRNHFPLGLDAPGYLLVAGGIGITALLGMARALAARGSSLRLLYVVRSPADAAFAGELRSLLGPRLVLAPGTRPDLGAAIAALHPAGEMYVCGPIGLLEAAKRAWKAAARPVAALRFETFGSGGRYPTEPFQVSIPRLGLTLTIPAERSLLDGLEAVGIPMIHHCRRGECGLCALPILATTGPVDHRDVFFTEAEKAENTKLCTCVSRSPGAHLTLDTGARP